MLQILCNSFTILEDILEAVSSGGSPAVLLPQVVFEAAAIPAVYTATGFLDGTSSLRQLYVNNSTDADVDLSFNGGTDTHYTVFANTIREIDFENLTLTSSGDMFFRTVDTASIGQVVFEGSY